ncbi:MAG: hypothetical protein ACK5S6_05295 [bacterium]
MSGDSFPYDGDDDFVYGDDDFLIENSEETLLEQLLTAKPSIADIPAHSSTVFDMMNDISEFVNNSYGQSGMYAMMCAIEAQTGWSLEIVGSKTDVETLLYENYGIFDEHAWLKARNSPYWDMMVRQMYEVSAEWNQVIVSTIADKKPPLHVRVKYAWRVLTRRF